MKSVLCETKEKLAYLTINRDEKRNALSMEVMTRLGSYFDDLSADPAIEAIILRSVGVAFSAGADLDELKTMQGRSFEQNVKDSHAWKDFFLKVYNCPKLVVAQVQGAAIAGGCGLVSLCDFVLASKRASFGCPEVAIGFVPAIIMFFLMQKVGTNWAREMVLSGEILSAERAYTVGLVNRLVAPEALERTTEDFVRTLLKRNSSHAMQLSKRIWQKLQDMPMKEAIAYAAETNAMARSSQDCKWGVANFLSKKGKIDWQEMKEKT